MNTFSGNQYFAMLPGLITLHSQEDLRTLQCMRASTQCVAIAEGMAISEHYTLASQAEGTLPSSIEEKETHWLKGAVIPLHHKAENEGLVGIWRVARSTWLQNLAARIILVSNSTPCGYKFVGDLEVVLRQSIIISYVHVSQACSPRALAKSFCNHSSSSILAFSFHAGDDMILAA
eukprot:1139054-Pelagomonas_calceolata.AAC.5